MTRDNTQGEVMRRIVQELGAAIADSIHKDVLLEQMSAAVKERDARIAELTPDKVEIAE